MVLVSVLQIFWKKYPKIFLKSRFGRVSTLEITFLISTVDARFYII